MRYIIKNKKDAVIFLKKKLNVTSINKISIKLNMDIKNIIFKNKTISIEQRKKIPLGNKWFKKTYHVPISILKEHKPIKRDELFSEFIGIMLGDGNLRESQIKKIKPPFKSIQYVIRVTINKKEKEYIKYIREVFQRLFGLELKEYHQKNFVQLNCYSKKLVESLKKFGLVPNNKIKNQVGIPDWIFKKRKWIKSCFIGLVDTDGSLYQRQDGYWVLNFSNKSKQLLNDFRKMCNILSVHYSNNQHCVQICRQSNIRHIMETFNFHRIRKKPHEV